MYSILVLQFGLSPDYILDHMSMYEIEALMEYGYLKDKTSWEQTRTVSYITAQCQSTKKLDPKQMFPFPWDSDYVISDSLSDEEREQIKREMKEMEEEMNKKDN